MSEQNVEQENVESAEQEHVEDAIDEAVDAVRVQSQELEEGADATGEPIGLDGLLGVPVEVTIRVGCTSMPLSELVKLAPGSLIPLDRDAHEPADVLVSGKLLARGEIVTIDDKLGVRITSVEIASS